MRKIKKAQLQQLGALAVGLGVLSITLVIAFLVMTEGRDNMEGQTATSTVTLEHILAVSNLTRKPFTASAIAIPGTVTCVGVSNATAHDGDTIPADNYTCTDQGIQLVGVNVLTITNVSVNYTYKARTKGYNSTMTLQSATDSVPGWIPIIIVVVIGGVVLALTAMFRKR